MKFLPSILIGFLFSTGLHAQSSLPPVGAAPTDKQSCSVSGIAVRQDTGEPLIKARITLVAQSRIRRATFFSKPSLAPLIC